MPAAGAGWGGPAKGKAATRGAKKEPKPGQPLPPSTPETIARREAKQRTDEERLAVYDEIAFDETAPHIARIQAVTHYRNQVHGMPVQRQQQLGADGKPVNPTAPALNVTIARE